MNKRVLMVLAGVAVALGLSATASAGPVPKSTHHGSHASKTRAAHAKHAHAVHAQHATKHKKK